MANWPKVGLAPAQRLEKAIDPAHTLAGWELRHLVQELGDERHEGHDCLDVR